MFRFPPVPNNCQGHAFHVCLWKSISSGSKIIVNNMFCCFSFSLDKCFLQFKMIVKDMFCSFQSQLRSMFSNKEIPFSLWMSHTNTKLKCIIVCTKTCKDTIFLATQVLISCFPIKCSIWMDAFWWLCDSHTSEQKHWTQVFTCWRENSSFWALLLKSLFWCRK